MDIVLTGTSYTHHPTAVFVLFLFKLLGIAFIAFVIYAFIGAAKNRKKNKQ